MNSNSSHEKLLASGFIRMALWMTHDGDGRSLDETGFQVSEPKRMEIEMEFSHLLESECGLQEYIHGLSRLPLGGPDTAGTQCFFAAKGIMPDLFLIKKRGIFITTEEVVEFNDLTQAIRNSRLRSIDIR